MEEKRYYLEKINRQISLDAEDYIDKCERRYSSMLRQYVREIVSKNEENKIIMLAGPSSSGKTTGANKLARLFSRMGYGANVISLDDFYKNRDDVIPEIGGKQDFESVQALELDLLTDCLKSLSLKGETYLPHFDFETGMRHDNIMHLVLEPGDVVIVEGLHALNTAITDCLPGKNLVKMYVSVASDIYNEKDEIVFDRKEIRFLRRLIRDYQFRNSSVEKTYGMWPTVISGEQKNLIPLIDTADYILDSIHPYELCVYKYIAVPMLSGVSPDNDYYDNAMSIVDRLEKFHKISPSLIPKTSLLCEFVGK